MLLLFLVPIITSSLLDFKQKRKDEAAYQEFLAAEEAKRVAEKKAYLTGKFNPKESGDFVLIPPRLTFLGNEMYLRRETYEAFLRMEAAAELDGIKLKIASATRNFDYQKNIWNNKWFGKTLVDGHDLSQSQPDGLERFKKILEYSAAPGTSRHHWGTDLDINYAIPSYFESGRGKLEYEWLAQNAAAFGFCQPYGSKNPLFIAGYREEKWHWSYLPLAKNFTQEYAAMITPEDISGFMGEEYVRELNLTENYVLNINPECL